MGPIGVRDAFHAAPHDSCKYRGLRAPATKFSSLASSGQHAAASLGSQALSCPSAVDGPERHPSGRPQSLLSSRNGSGAHGKHEHPYAPDGNQNTLQKASPRMQRRAIVDGKETHQDKQHQNGDA